jgi:hypothetical protein
MGLLSHDLAYRKASVSNFDALLDDLGIIAADVPAHDDFATAEVMAEVVARVRKNFDRDYERIAATQDMLFGADYKAYSTSAAEIFSRWEEEGGGPLLPVMVAAAAEHFRLDIHSAPVRAAFMAALLAEVPNSLQYHGNEHYRKVLFHALRLVAAHNHIFAGTANVIGAQRIALLIAASCMHDLGHEGGDNQRDGVYTPGFMEQRALDIARPYFDAVELSADDRGEIETIVFCTDITFFAGDNSPCVRMKKLYRHYFWDEDVGDASMLMMGRLRRYEDDPGLVRLAMLLHEADVGSSAGLTYEQTRKETMAIIEERDLKVAGPGIVLTFLREQLGETMYTEAGKQVFGPAMREIIKAAETEVAAGRKTFYD